jgi:hypothetical protein
MLLDQFIRRLFAGLSDFYRGSLPRMLYYALQEDPSLEPAVVVRVLHAAWRLGGVELSEEIYEALAEFSGGRRAEFMNALSRFAATRNNSEIDQDSFRSQVSFVTISGETATTASLTNSVGASTVDGDTLSLASAGAAATAASTGHTMEMYSEDSPSSTPPDAGIENQDTMVFDSEDSPSSALPGAASENRDEDQSDIPRPVDADIVDISLGPIENQVLNDKGEGAWNSRNCCNII